MQPRPPADDGASRLVSLDALRGFDMFWIVGGREIVVALSLATGWPLLARVEAQLHHVEWDGFTAWDLVFPLFLFVAGAAMPWSLGRRLERGDGRARVVRHVLRRGFALVLLGAVYNGLLAFDFENLRLASVLGRIGLAWMLAALVFLFVGTRGLALAGALLLLGYWAALAWVPVPGFGAGNLAPGATLTDWVDRQLLPGRLYRGDRDPEGLLGTLPAVATALSGALAGCFLRDSRASGTRKSLVLAGAGAVSLLVGGLWDTVFPINKNLWSSSFVLWTTGWSALLLALFHQVIDVWRVRAWAFFFVVLGSNAILIYMLAAFVPFHGLVELLLAKGLHKLHPVLVACAAVGLEWALLYALWRRRLFLRV